MTAIIEIQDLTKRYGGRNPIKAVDQLNFSIQEGDIFGFVGPNGAGKTSTIRIMCTLLAATHGDIRVAGYSVHKQPEEVRAVIGYMPDFFGVYHDMQVWEYLDFFGACYNIPVPKRMGLINDLLELVDLSHRRNDEVESLSRGMKQRLSLARTLIHDPKVLILDEPASGLDPRARVEIRELMVQLAKMGKTIFFSTHILADVAQICTRVGIIEGGKLVACGALEELQQVILPHRQIQLTVLDDFETVHAYLLNYEGVLGMEKAPQNGEQRTRIEVNFNGDDEALSKLVAGLVGQGVRLVHVSEDQRDMEEVFMRATKGFVT
jgi:ABC-2 type transport system ATP-binding protein